MTQTKTSPGPWHAVIDPRDTGGHFADIYDAAGWRVAMTVDIREPGEGHANGRLVAAAPCMRDELFRIHVGTTITTEHFNRIQRLLDRVGGVEP